MIDWLAAILYRFLGRTDRYGGDCVSPPGDGLELRFSDDGLEMYVATWPNDGGTLAIGTEDHWQIDINFRNALRLAFWIIFRWWIWSKWFGLRRWVWYWALNRQVNRTLRIGKTEGGSEDARPVVMENPK